MWTPRRVLLLIGSLIVFWLGYEVYAFFLDNIDGLQPLPKDFWKQEGELQPMAVGLPLREMMLAQAFGDECEELHRGIKLHVSRQGRRHLRRSVRNR